MWFPALDWREVLHLLLSHVLSKLVLLPHDTLA